MFSLLFMCNIIIIMCTCIYTDNNNLHNVDSLSTITNRDSKNMHRADNFRSNTVVIKGGEFGE